MARTALLVCTALVVAVAHALDNGLGRTPQMGYSSWNDCSSNVTEAHMKEIVAFLVSSGLAAKGYTYINVDEGWLQGRDENGTIVSDPVKFPSGMKGFGDWVHAQEYAPGKHFRYGLYTCRGTCQCSTQWYHGPGSQGHEEQDAQYFAAAGADYLKEDSCCGSQDHETAFHQYGLMRDALNRTGRPIFFSLCGWNSWYAPVGASLGNSWRIHGDGSGWDHLSDATNTMAGIVQFSGPGGWNDPDLLIGPNVKVGGQTDLQSRSQFSLWAVMAAPLLISSNLLEASAYAIETWGNTEVIAVSQDPLAKPGFRIAGTNYSYPCSSTGGDYTVEVLPCITAADGSIDPSQAWFFNSSSGQMVFAGSTSTKGPLVLDNWQCGTVDRNPVTLFTPDHGTGTCQGKNQVWQYSTSSMTFTNAAASNMCLDAYEFVGPQVDLWSCNGGDNQKWKLGLDQTTQVLSMQGGSGAPRCLTAVAATSCTNVWGRPLDKGDFAVTMVNNGPANSSAPVACDAQCLRKLGLDPAASYTVRDLWAHSDSGRLVAPFHLNATVVGDGGCRMFRLSKNTK